MTGRRPDDPFDYHDPTRGIGGAPPARSALGLRLALALFGVVVCVGGAVAFGIVTGSTVAVVVLLLLAAIAAVDAVVVTLRMRSERRGR